MRDPRTLLDDRTLADEEAGDRGLSYYDRSGSSYRLDGRGLRFEHGVNSRATLDEFLRNSTNIAEADVLMGTVGTDPEPQPVMAHPPDRHSDLSFDEWLQAMVAYGCGIKVDFKESAVVPAVLASLERESFPAYRLMLNADILVGPGGGSPQLGVDDLYLCREAFPDAVLSISCTTGPDAGPYSDIEISNLLQAGDLLGGPYTLALRAELLLADLSVLQVLSDHDAHVTVWNAPNYPTEEGWLDLLQARLPLAFFDLIDPAPESADIESL